MEYIKINKSEKKIYIHKVNKKNIKKLKKKDRQEVYIK